MAQHNHHRHAAFHASNILNLGHQAAAAVAGEESVGMMTPVIDIAPPSRVIEARAESSSSCGQNKCEKPVSSSPFTLPIALGVVIPVVGAAILFFYLHRRHLRKQREEDANDRHASMDFGLGNVPQPGRPKRGGQQTPDVNFGDEKGHQSRRQVSMDMTVNSPYLLPPELQNSRESLHSLSRSIQQEDPYRPVSQYHPGDSASIRSQSKQGSSIYTGSSKTPSRFQESITAELLPNAGPMSRSSPPTPYVPPPRQNSLPQNKATSPIEISSAPTPPPPYPLPAEPTPAHLTDSLVARKGLPANPRSHQGLAPQLPAVGKRASSGSNGDAAELRKSNNYLGAFINDSDFSASQSPPPPPAKSDEQDIATPKAPSTFVNSLPSNPRPPRKESMPAVQPQTATFIDNNSEYGDGFKVTPPSPGRDTHADLTRGQRYSMDVPPEEYVQAGLGAPGLDTRRISMGFRPLPPNAVTEHDDPEIRANRIRSFYKEYFDESKPAPQGQYYEDYDVNYLGDAAYYEPETNAFVMPYAQPMPRRAMTPPPAGARAPPRFQGPPRPRNGSMGAMSARGPRGPQMYPPGPYPQGPRAFSSASGHVGNRGPKRPIPPPAPLHTIPTPSKLKDDSFAIMNALEFAPPQTYRDRVAGRSESPLGERRPYSPALPSYAPIASSFDELAAMPSPHMLRKSGTFTGLDFAPPKKFRDPDTMSDSGSIRSNRSGVSAMHNQAIRNGAYRVSKIPEDAVFTKDDLATTLKPQWGMRAGS